MRDGFRFESHGCKRRSEIAAGVCLVHVGVIREISEFCDVIAESKSFPVLVGCIPKHCIKDLIRAEVTGCVGDKLLTEHKRQELRPKKATFGLVLQFEVKRMARGIGAMLGQAVTKGLEDITRGSDLGADLGVLVGLCAESDQLLDKMALRSGFPRSGHTALAVKRKMEGVEHGRG